MKGRKLAFIISSIILFICLAITVVICISSNDSQEETMQHKLYTMAVESGYDGTYEEWLNSIRGDSVELSIREDKLMWKYSNENFWNTLIDLDELAGVDGREIILRISENFIQWQYSGEDIWNNLIDINSLVGAKGEKGSEIELQVSEGYIKWKYDNEEEWNNLIELSSLVGAKGDKGDTPYIGENGNWFISGVDTLVVAEGKDGLTPYIGSNGNWFIGDEDTNFKAIGIDGLKGDKGDPGKSAFEIFLEYHPDFVGTEEDWLKTLKGETGNTGIGILDITIDYRGHVIIKLSDGSIHEVEIKESSCEHNYSSYIVYPTCLKEGYTQYTCSICGYSYKNDFVAESGHHYANNSCVYCGSAEPFGEISINIDWYNSSLKEFVISSRNELAGLAYLVNNGTNFSGCIISLNANIDLAYAEWIPIGTETAPFAGTFNGNNFTINKLKISKLDNYVGLFGNVSGYISNINISNANIRNEYVGNYVGILCGYTTKQIIGVTTSGYIDAERALYVGGIVGYSTEYIQNCVNYADIVGNSYTGGIAGFTGTTNSTPYYNLKNYGEVKGNENTGGVIGRLYNNKSKYGTSYYMYLNMLYNYNIIVGNDYTGGIIGYLYVNNPYNDSTLHTINIEDLQNSGEVNGGIYTGGLIGYGYAKSNSSLISQSKNKANIIGKSYIGGIAGYFGNILIDSCENGANSIEATSLSVNSDSENVVYLGGYVGYGYSVLNCSNKIDITYSLSGNYIGGIAGYLVSIVENCENTGNINAPNSSSIGGITGCNKKYINNSTNYGDIIGYSQCGGITGYSNSTASTPFSDLKNYGSITSGEYSGGVFGRINHKPSSYGTTFNINMDMIYNHGEVVGSNYTGGIVGKMEVSNIYSSSYVYVLKAEDVYNNGNITGKIYTGGIFGYASAEGDSYIRNSKNDSYISGTAYVGGISGYANKILIDSCDNGLKTIEATGMSSNDEESVVYLGGYVGLGYKVYNCINNIDLLYNSNANYVGGIAGELTLSVENCENYADITALNSSYVGGVVGKNGSYIIDAKNTGDIIGYEYVSGIAGFSNTSKEDIYSNLINNGSITGNRIVSGIIGSLKSVVSSYGTNYELLCNTMYNYGSINAKEYVSGIIAYFYVNNTYNSSYNYSLLAEGLENSGSINGGLYVGGLFGYGYSDGVSKIFNSKNRSSIVGEAYVGGIAGWLENITIDNCSNEKSTISATSSTVEDESTVVYLGGFVGNGYSVLNCTNSIELNYTGNGLYVGGIAGFLSGGSQYCTNTANITGFSGVGGITGRSSCLYGDGIYQHLENSGSIKGKNFVGGISGYVYDSWSGSVNSTIIMSNINNKGHVIGNEYVAGIFGYMYSNDGNYSANIVVKADIIKTIGTIQGNDYVGQIFGSFYSDGSSILSTFETNGSIWSSGENVDTVVGEFSNLTF